MRIICKDNKEKEGQLRLNHEYTPIEETETSYIIKLGNGVKGTYLKSRFEKVEE